MKKLLIIFAVLFAAAMIGCSRPTGQNATHKPVQAAPSPTPYEFFPFSVERNRKSLDSPTVGIYVDTGIDPGKPMTIPPQRGETHQVDLRSIDPASDKETRQAFDQVWKKGAQELYEPYGTRKDNSDDSNRFVAVQLTRGQNQRETAKISWYADEDADAVQYYVTNNGLVELTDAWDGILRDAWKQCRIQHFTGGKDQTIDYTWVIVTEHEIDRRGYCPKP